MRMIVVKQASDLQALAARLVKAGSGTQPAASLDALRALNPHLDFNRVPVGTVLLVPDHPDFAGGAAESVGGEAFDSLAQDALAGLAAAAARLRAGSARHDADRKDVTAVLRSAAFKRLTEADRALGAQATEAEARMKDAAKREATAQAMLAEIEKSMKGELETLRRRFDGGAAKRP